MRLYVIILLSLTLSACKVFKKQRALFPVGSDYVPHLTNLRVKNGGVKYANFNITDHLSLVKYSTLDDSNYTYLQYSELNNKYFLNDKKNIDTIQGIDIESTRVEDNMQPEDYKSYLLNYYDTISLYSLKIISTKNGKIIKQNPHFNSSNLFPNELTNTFEETFYIFRVPIIDDCNQLSSYGIINYELRPLSSDMFLVLNPYSTFYLNSIQQIWYDYQIFIHCQLITVDTSTLSGKQKENLLMPFELRQFDEKLNEIFIEQCKGILKSNFQADNAKMFKSYFELIFWQIYRPSDFKVKDNKGKRRSFLFTSSNPDYPGNYEVKFNIYEPYRFKVFKR